jgi:hypothetical protein
MYSMCYSSIRYRRGWLRIRASSRVVSLRAPCRSTAALSTRRLRCGLRSRGQRFWVYCIVAYRNVHIPFFLRSVGHGFVSGLSAALVLQVLVLLEPRYHILLVSLEPARIAADVVQALCQRLLVVGGATRRSACAMLCKRHTPCRRRTSRPLAHPLRSSGSRRSTAQRARLHRVSQPPTMGVTHERSCP